MLVTENNIVDLFSELTELMYIYTASTELSQDSEKWRFAS